MILPMSREKFAIGRDKRFVRLENHIRKICGLSSTGRILVLDKDGEIHSLLTGDYYGDKSIKANAGDKSHEDAITEEDTTCWVLSRKDLEDVIGDIDRLNDDYMPFRRSVNQMNIRQKDLQLYRILGTRCLWKGVAGTE